MYIIYKMILPNLQNDPLLAPYVVITILLTVFPVLYFTRIGFLTECLRGITDLVIPSNTNVLIPSGDISEEFTQVASDANERLGVQREC